MSSIFFSKSLSGQIDPYDYARQMGAGSIERGVLRHTNVKARLWKPKISDDWPDKIPISEAELDLFEAHFGDVLDGLLLPDR